MRYASQKDNKSSGIEPDELSVLFSQMLESPQQSKIHLMHTLESITSVQTHINPFPAKFKLSAIKLNFLQQQHYLRLFPGVFIPLTKKSSFAASWPNKLMLKWANLPYIAGDDNLLQLKTISFTQISLLLQMLIYLAESKFPEYSALAKAKHSSTAVYLNHQLGASYSQGQFLDFVDRLYDQYKHTKLSPYTFRHLFRCFGCHTPTIANHAFDYYMQSRNTNNAWLLAIDNYLQSQLYVPKSVAQSVAALLLHNNHLQGKAYEK